jgi:hypothetical protein
MIKGFDTVYHLKDGRLAQVDRRTDLTDPTSRDRPSGS